MKSSMKKIKKGLYRHYKGNDYEVLGTAKHSESLDDLVVYKALYENKDFGKNSLWARPYVMFHENVIIDNKPHPRFRFIEDVPSYPRVGVGVIVKYENKFLIGQRKGAHGEDTWSVPGGNLDYGESPEQCAKREVLEETGLNIVEPSFIALTSDVFKTEKKHYVTLWLTAVVSSNTFKITEPDKYINIRWISIEDLPSKLFLPLKNFLKVKNNRQYFT